MSYNLNFNFKNNIIYRSDSHSIRHNKKKKNKQNQLHDYSQHIKKKQNQKKKPIIKKQKE